VTAAPKRPDPWGSIGASGVGGRPDGLAGGTDDEVVAPVTVHVSPAGDGEAEVALLDLVGGAEGEEGVLRGNRMREEEGEGGEPGHDARRYSGHGSRG
jgi:hypothetical protein